MANALIPFIAILIGAAAGISLNILFKKYVKRLWIKIILFLISIFVTAQILAGIGKLLILRVIPSVGGIGEAIGAGIAMALGLIFFILLGLIVFIISFITTSLVRYIRKKKRRFKS